MMRGETKIERIRDADARAREAHIEAHPPRTARQKIGRADIGKEAYTRLRHSKQGMLAHHPVRTVKRDADAAAHHHAIYQGQIGLGKTIDQRVQTVFLLIKGYRELARRIVLLLVQKADIAARAERHPAIFARGALDRHGTNRRICLPSLELVVEGDRHRLGQRVKRLRPV